MERRKEDRLAFVRLTNLDLTCRDCKFQLDDAELPQNTSKCQRYNVKPDGVLMKGKCVRKILIR